MSPRAKKEYLKAIVSRYKQASRPEKRIILVNSVRQPDIIENIP